MILNYTLFNLSYQKCIKLLGFERHKNFKKNVFGGDTVLSIVYTFQFYMDDIKIFLTNRGKHTCKNYIIMIDKYFYYSVQR